MINGSAALSRGFRDETARAGNPALVWIVGFHRHLQAGCEARSVKFCRLPNGVQNMAADRGRLFVVGQHRGDNWYGWRTALNH